MSHATRQEVFYFEEIVDNDKDTKTTEETYTLSECHVLNDTSDLPSKRGGATLTAVLAAQGNTLLYLIGGANRAAETFGDVHVFDWDAKRWTQAKPSIGSTTFTPRSGHTAVARGSRIYVFGGANLRVGAVFNDLHVLDTDTMTWSQPEVGGDVPPARNSHVAVATDKGMVVIGGSSPQVGAMNDVYLLAWDDDMSWRRIRPSSSTVMSKRELHAACAIHDRILVVGGRSSSGILCDDVCELHTDSWTWTITPLTSWHRCAHAAGVLGGTHWVHFGGWGGGHDFLSDCWQLPVRPAACHDNGIAGPPTSPTTLNAIEPCQTSMHPVPLQVVHRHSPPPPPLEETPHIVDVALVGSEEAGLVGRFAHCACVVEDASLVMFGGMTTDADLHDLWVLTRLPANTT
ncbi:hypothetical protein, variant [Aphanomyces astaci]|uniref:Uncharacterized protein n=1 Tax=Aphanomyces astaci TaxID=112090 RepID=W4H9J2_APHAT|nr:hypothetical protein, variant [Aphanomyces astaci]ETV88577.1 hypothetical protein, variant [Aphanomyces astaci]|eukprot:XP_009820977.1 hypothetical protein, variant [Aphanomyces astaci]